MTATQNPSNKLTQKASTALDNINQLQQLVLPLQTINSSLSLVQHDLNLLLNGVDRINEIAPNLDDYTNSILIELQQARTLIAESVSVTNELYLACVDAMGVEK